MACPVFHNASGPFRPRFRPLTAAFGLVCGRALYQSIPRIPVSALLPLPFLSCAHLRMEKPLTLARMPSSRLEPALFGFEHQRSQIEEKMAELRRRIGGRAATVKALATKKRTMSAAARRRIGAAQRKRW